MFKSALAGQAATRRSRQLILRLLPALAALTLLIGLGCYLLIKNALSQDADVQQRSRTFVTRTIEQVRNEVGLNIINYSRWGEAYKNLHVKVDKRWADEQRNVGDIPYDLYGYNGVLVVGPQDRTVYAVIDGQPSAVQAGAWLQGDLPGLIGAARQAGENAPSIVRAFRVGGTAALAAASTITPGWDPAIVKTPGPDSVMIFVTVLSPDKLAHLSSTYGLPELTLSEHPVPGKESLALPGADIFLNWVAPRPGLQLLEETLPLFVAAGLALAGLLAVLISHAIASARQIDAQFDALLASQAEARHLSLHDFLTGLPNRYQLTQYLDSRLQQVPPAPITLLYLDLDRFKPINDALGHAAGDEVLQEVARRLRQQTPTGGMAARLGGDEFVMLLPGELDAERIDQLCASLVASICQPIRLQQQQIQIGTSIGIAQAPSQAGTVSELLRLSDLALYQAKSAGRNAWRIHEQNRAAL